MTEKTFEELIGIHQGYMQLVRVLTFKTMTLDVKQRVGFKQKSRSEFNF